MYIFKWKNVYGYLSFVDFAFFCLLDVRPHFCFAFKNIDLAGHMSFQKKKELEPWNSLASREKEIYRRWLRTQELKEFFLYDVLVLSLILG